MSTFLTVKSVVVRFIMVVYYLFYYDKTGTSMPVVAVELYGIGV